MNMIEKQYPQCYISFVHCKKHYFIKKDLVNIDKVLANLIIYQD